MENISHDIGHWVTNVLSLNFEIFKMKISIIFFRIQMPFVLYMKINHANVILQIDSVMHFHLN